MECVVKIYLGISVFLFCIILSWILKAFFLNSLPNDKILDWSKFRAFTNKKIDATEKLKFVLGRVEKIVRKGENAGYQHFLLFPQCFQKASFSRLLKVGIVW